MYYNSYIRGKLTLEEAYAAACNKLGEAKSNDKKFWDMIQDVNKLASLLAEKQMRDNGWEYGIDGVTKQKVWIKIGQK